MMALVEQLVFGNPAASEPGRAVIGCSEGLEQHARDEIVRLCEGWGGVPEGGLQRPVLLAYPLEARLRELPGDLFCVVRISAGLRPIFHAVVISGRDYQSFDLNPYALLNENIFLDAFTASQTLPRRAVQPTALVPLVTPPPGRSDVGGIDEAVRQVMANDNLLLPLEQPTSDSDRFMALTVAALPRTYRRVMRFASWAPAGINHHSLAATFKDSAYFSSWQPYLMTTVIGDLEQPCRDYLEKLVDCLEDGDMAAIERLSQESRIDPGRKKIVGKRLTETAVSSKLSPPRPSKPRALAATLPPVGTPSGGRRAQPAVASARPVARAGGPIADRRPRPEVRRGRPRRPETTGGARRGFAVLLSLAIVVAGAWYLWSEGHWTRLPGLADASDVIQSRTEHGVVDIGAVYRAALDDAQVGGMMSRTNSPEDRRRRGLEMLGQASQLLETQSRDYLRNCDQTLAGPDQAGTEPAPALPLQERGQVIARELRRLVLARVSLRDAVEWRDLAELDQRGLRARYDSLVAGRALLANEPGIDAIDALLRQLDVTTRQVRSYGELQSLLGAESWHSGWSDRVQAAIDGLGVVRQPHAQTVRDDAQVLARLKRAEHRPDFTALAFRAPETFDRVASPAVADILPQLYRRADRREAREPLLRATADLHRALAELAGGQATLRRLDALLAELGRNRALAFDPVAYGDHVERLRFLRFELAADDSTAASDVTTDRSRFLQALDANLDAAGWQDLAATLEEPFLLRWAQHAARQADARARERREALNAAIADLDTRRIALLRQMEAGTECGPLWNELLAQVDQLRDQHASAGADSPLVSATASLAALQRALEAPRELDLVGVTVRLAPGLSDGAFDAIIELRVGSQQIWTQDAIAIGPSAPAGTGWVGSATIDWTVPLAMGEDVEITVRRADDRSVVAVIGPRPWLAGIEPADLGSLSDGQGARLAFRLARPYWDGVGLPRLVID